MTLPYGLVNISSYHELLRFSGALPGLSGEPAEKGMAPVPLGAENDEGKGSQEVEVEEKMEVDEVEEDEFYDVEEAAEESEVPSHKVSRWMFSIGMSSYEQLKELPNTINDSKTLEDIFGSLGLLKAFVC